MDFHGIEIKSLETNDRVAAGMAFLDRFYPGHESHVDLEELNVSSGTWCPLAQATDNDYSSAVDDLWDEHKIDLRGSDDRIRMVQWLGFMLLDMEHSSEQLSDAWVAAYRARREAQLIK